MESPNLERTRSYSLRMKNCNLDHTYSGILVIPACYWRLSIKGRRAGPAATGACAAGFSQKLARMTEGSIGIKNRNEVPYPQRIQLESRIMVSYRTPEKCKQHFYIIQLIHWNLKKVPIQND